MNVLMILKIFAFNILLEKFFHNYLVLPKLLRLLIEYYQIKVDEMEREHSKCERDLEHLDLNGSLILSMSYR